MAELAVLHEGAASVRTRALAIAANRRLDARGLDAYMVKIPAGIGADPAKRLALTPAVFLAIRKAAWALGASLTTLEKMDRTGDIPIGVQRLILNPGKRKATPAGREQIQRGTKRVSRATAQRKKRAEAAAREKRDHGTSSRTRAVNAFLAKVGTREQPSGSNGGGLITAMEAFYGFGRVAWCGISAGYHAERFGGLDLASDVASVAAIEAHARAHHPAYGRWQTDPRGAFPGSFVVIGGHGVHVGMLVDALPDGSAKTVEGNTSFTNAGSQSNGGCIAAKVRSPAAIYGVATMNYPNR